jgi:FkbM family methyltransferase
VPDPKTFATLERNVHYNGLSDVACHQVTLHDTNGNIDLYQSENETICHIRMSTLQEHLPTSGKVQVAARKLSAFIDGEIDLSKMPKSKY